MIERERLRLEKLNVLLRENGIGKEAARKEERSGWLAARREELVWVSKKRKGEQR